MIDTTIHIPGDKARPVTLSTTDVKMMARLQRLSVDPGCQWRKTGERTIDGMIVEERWQCADHKLVKLLAKRGSKPSDRFKRTHRY